MRQYEMYEMMFEGEAPAGSQVEIDLNADFIKDGEITRVKGFYAGNHIYKIRFYPKKTGIYEYRVSGLFSQEGTVTCEPAREGKHGIVRTKGTHFCQEDGTWFYPFGTTVYALIHQEKWLIEETMETLRQSPFNKIRICLFPKHYLYNENEPELFAFEKNQDQWDTGKPCFAFWDALDERIAQLDEMGIQCDLILFHSYDHWGFADLTREQAGVYLDYAVRRLSAHPNLWWSLANEYDLLNYTKEDWEYFAHLIHTEDPYGHLLSNHQMIREWDASNADTTHSSLQIKDVNTIHYTMRKYQKPVMVDECRYEGDIFMEWGNISGFEMVNRFWKICVQGGYCTHGETFMSADDILWWAKGGKLKGESPKRIAFLKSIIEELPGPLTYGRDTITIEDVEKMHDNPPEDPFLAKFLTLYTDEEMMVIFRGDRTFIGKCGEEAFIKYYERQCVRQGMLDLPENKTYKIEKIDAWEMTREVVLEHAGGHVEIELPGKEGMAVMATLEK